MLRHYPLIGLLFILGMVGCDKDAPIEENPVPAPSATALRVVKDGTALILVDVQPEWDRLLKLTAPQRAAYFKRQAVMEALNLPTDQPQFAGKDRVKVRMVLLQGRDEYNRPKWGNAGEVAVFELSRSALDGITAESVNHLPDPNLNRLFLSVQINGNPPA
jgi:hypothetical protein